LEFGIYIVYFYGIVCLFQFEGGKQPDSDMQGVIQRSFKYLIQQLSQVTGSKTIKASYLEIYNEQVNNKILTFPRQWYL
jgi:hypothetical protein